MGESLRLFIALTLTPSVQSALQDPLQTIRSSLNTRIVRWIPSENVHLTLKFLGDVPRSQVEAVQDALVLAAEGFGPMSMRIEGIGCFPNEKRPRIVWLGLKDQTQQVQQLQQSVEEAVVPLGYPADKRRFTPHLTIGRVRRDTRADQLMRLGQQIQTMEIGAIAQWDCAEVCLMQSDLRPQGAVYSCLYQSKFSKGVTHG